MKAEVRRRIADLRCELEDNFTFCYAVPSNMRFGDEPDEGTSICVARADHVHGMPASPHAIIDAMTNESFQFSEMMWQDTASPFSDPYDGVHAIIGAAGIFGTIDDEGDTGAFGSVSINLGTASASQASAVIFYSDATTVNVSVQNEQHYPRRLKRFSTRMKAQKTVGANEQGAPVLSRVVVGGARTLQATTASGWLSNIQSGICLVIDTDASAQGTWKALTGDGTAFTIVDTGVSFAPDVILPFQQYEILFDGTTVQFFIDNVLVAEIDENIPTSNVAGWGTFMHHAARTNSHRLTVDEISFRGARSA